MIHSYAKNITIDCDEVHITRTPTPANNPFRPEVLYTPFRAEKTPLYDTGNLLKSSPGTAERKVAGLGILV